MISFLFCACLDLRPPPTVQTANQGAAGRGQITAAGGEEHPRKLPQGAERFTRTKWRPDAGTVRRHLIGSISTVAVLKLWTFITVRGYGPMCDTLRIGFTETEMQRY